MVQITIPPCRGPLSPVWRLATCAALLAIACGAASAGPVRLARFSVVSGDVSWRPNETTAWAPAVRNLPIRQGGWIAVNGPGRCALQFDDGSFVYLGGGAVVSLNTLYSDSQGEYTEIAARNGYVACRLREPHGVFQVDTPLVNLDARGPCRFRADCANGVQVGVREGSCVCEGRHGRSTLATGQYLNLANESASYTVAALPPH